MDSRLFWVLIGRYMTVGHTRSRKLSDLFSIMFNGVNFYPSNCDVFGSSLSIFPILSNRETRWLLNTEKSISVSTMLALVCILSGQTWGMACTTTKAVFWLDPSHGKVLEELTHTCDAGFTHSPILPFLFPVTNSGTSLGTPRSKGHTVYKFLTNSPHLLYAPSRWRSS